MFIFISMLVYLEDISVYWYLYACVFWNYVWKGEIILFGKQNKKTDAYLWYGYLVNKLNVFVQKYFC